MKSEADEKNNLNLTYRKVKGYFLKSNEGVR